MPNKLLEACLQCVLLTQSIFVVGRFYSCVKNPDDVDFPVSYYSFSKNDCFQNHETSDPAVPEPVEYPKFPTEWNGFPNLTFKESDTLPRKKRIRTTPAPAVASSTAASIQLLRTVILKCLKCVGKAQIFDSAIVKCIKNEMEMKGDGPFLLNEDQCVNFYTYDDSILHSWEYSRRIPRQTTTMITPMLGKTTANNSNAATIQKTTSYSDINYKSPTTAKKNVESTSSYGNFEGTAVYYNAKAASTSPKTVNFEPSISTQRIFTRSNSITTEEPTTVAHIASTMTPTISINTSSHDASTDVIVGVVVTTVIIIFGLGVIWRLKIFKESLKNSTHRSAGRIDDSIELVDLRPRADSLYIIDEEEEL